jgi:hypothetical protein
VVFSLPRIYLIDPTVLPYLGEFVPLMMSPVPEVEPPGCAQPEYFRCDPSQPFRLQTPALDGGADRDARQRVTGAPLDSRDQRGRTMIRRGAGLNDAALDSGADLNTRRRSRPRRSIAVTSIAVTGPRLNSPAPRSTAERTAARLINLQLSP